jgi:hypothetical protein
LFESSQAFNARPSNKSIMTVTMYKAEEEEEEEAAEAVMVTVVA